MKKSRTVLAIATLLIWAGMYYYYLPALYLSNPEPDDKDILELTDEEVPHSVSVVVEQIEYNNNDIEAFKLLTKLFIKENNYEDIISILETRLEHDEDGDLYYVMAQVYRKIGDLENYAKNLNYA